MTGWHPPHHMGCRPASHTQFIPDITEAIFRKFDVNVPEGRVAFTPTEARHAAQKLPGFPVVVKAQTHAGGRCKGGVKLAQSLDGVESLAGEILGMTLG